MKFVMTTTTAGTPTWKLVAANDEMVAWAGESFHDQSGALRAARAFKAGALSARYEVYLDDGGHYRWRAWRSSDKVAASGEAFASKPNAERAAESVRLGAGIASGA